MIPKVLPLLPLQRAARAAGVDPNTLRAWRARGLPTHRFAGVPMVDLWALLHYAERRGQLKDGQLPLRMSLRVGRPRGRGAPKGARLNDTERAWTHRPQPTMFDGGNGQ